MSLKKCLLIININVNASTIEQDSKMKIMKLLLSCVDSKSHNLNSNSDNKIMILYDIANYSVIQF